MFHAYEKDGSTTGVQGMSPSTSVKLDSVGRGGKDDEEGSVRERRSNEAPVRLDHWHGMSTAEPEVAADTISVDDHDDDKEDEDEEDEEEGSRRERW